MHKCRFRLDVRCCVVNAVIHNTEGHLLADNYSLACTAVRHTLSVRKFALVRLQLERDPEADMRGSVSRVGG